MFRAWRRRPPLVSTLVVDPSGAGENRFGGTVPLPGDWSLLRVLLAAGDGTPSASHYYWGVRLATEIPVTEAEWRAAERLWYGDELAIGITDVYGGDGFWLPQKAMGTVEGPFLVRARGRRLVVRFNPTYEVGADSAISFVLQSVE